MVGMAMAIPGTATRRGGTDMAFGQSNRAGRLFVTEAGEPIHGIMAEFATPADIYHASEKVRDAGYTRWDAYSPFPIHGMEEAMGVKRTKLPALVAVIGLSGAGLGFLMQSWMSAVDYPMLTQGKPFNSWQAFVPITFELGILSSAFAALKDGRYAESARRFQAFLDQYPSSGLASNAYYWLGESYYVTQNYKIALQSFQTLLQRYPESQKAPDALLKVGYSQYELKQWDQAEATLNQVVETYPDTTVAHLAQGRLRALKSESRR